jgi:hypothetical protein
MNRDLLPFLAAMCPPKRWEPCAGIDNHLGTQTDLVSPPLLSKTQSSSAEQGGSQPGPDIDSCSTANANRMDVNTV